MNLRDLLGLLRAENLLAEAREEADPNLEIAGALAALDGRPILFPKVRGSGMAVVGNLMCSRRLLALSLGVEEADLIARLAHARRHPADLPAAGEAPNACEVIEPADLTRLPVLKHLPKDGGAYITSCVVVVDDPELGRNLSFHRLMVRSPGQATIRVVKSRGLDQAIERAGGEIDAAFLIGAPSQVLLAAAMSPADDVDETRIAQALADTPMARCRTVALDVPAETEVLIEGRITRERGDEGPFVDLTETLDVVRQEPVVRFNCVAIRPGAVYHALLPGLGDHRTLMGLPREADIYSSVNEVCKCLDVSMRPGGCSWLHAVVRIEKANADDPRRAIDAALAAHPSLKKIVVVDADIDAHDAQAVEWAVATRFQAHRDLVVYANRPSSSLDPSADHPAGRKSVGAKMGLDATAPRRAKEFERLKYPPLTERRRLELFGGA